MVGVAQRTAANSCKLLSSCSLISDGIAPVTTISLSYAVLLKREIMLFTKERKRAEEERKRADKLAHQFNEEHTIPECLPPLGERLGSSTKASTHSNHQDATLKRSKRTKSGGYGGSTPTLRNGLQEKHAWTFLLTTRAAFNNNSQKVRPVGTTVKRMRRTKSNWSQPHQQRLVVASPILQYDDKRLFPTLASVLQKMVSSPLSYVPLVQTLRPYIYLTASSYEWQLGLPPTFKLQVNKLPGQNTTNFYLLQDLGAGPDGRVWLAATAYGTACALKYAHAALAFTLFKEAELWNAIWKRKARCQKIGGQLALVMPYVKPCTKEEFTKREVVAAIKEAAERMMEAGYDHGDLKREHVGLYCDPKGGHKAVFFDLARAKPLKPHKSSLSAILQQLNIE